MPARVVTISHATGAGGEAIGRTVMHLRRPYRHHSQMTGRAGGTPGLAQHLAVPTPR